jgi:endopeptidase Clp ATP-binding regulatory subunit ClpX
MSGEPPTRPPDPREVHEDLTRFVREKYGNTVDLRRFSPPTSAAKGDAPGPELDSEELLAHLRFDHRPAEVKEHLDRFVIAQDEAKKVLATAVCDHYHHIRRCQNARECRQYQKQNIIILGSTGIGKTYLVRSIADLIGVPCVRADATKFSETGYVGADVDDLVRELVHRAGGSIQLAECGIIYLDEVDKIAAPSSMIGRDVSGRGVQMGLLKLMEDTEVPLRAAHDLTGQLQTMMEFQTRGQSGRQVIHTRHILFIVSGAFTHLKDIVGRRVARRSIGFGPKGFQRDADFELLRQAKAADFIEFGFEPEFVGRLPVALACHDLSVEHLYEILTHSEGSILHQYREAFAAYDITVRFTAAGRRRVAEAAHREGTGARGLTSVLERTLRDFKFSLPGSEVKRFAVTEQTVDDPVADLARVLVSDPAAERAILLELLLDFESDFLARHGLAIHFVPAAAEALCERARFLAAEPSEVAAALLHGWEHGLQLIQAHTGQRAFEIPETVLARPREVLNEWIKAACSAAPATTTSDRERG